MSEKDDNIDIQRLRRGDTSICKELYDLYHKRLYSLAYKYLKSKELSEDAVHDAFIKLWEHRQKISTNIRGFLFSTTRNHVLNMIRNKKRVVLKHIQLEQQQAKFTNKTEEVILYSEYQTILASALNQLPEGKKEIFRLKSVQGLTNNEVAVKLDITINTVKSQYYEASRFIREYLSQHAGIKMKKPGNG